MALHSTPALRWTVFGGMAGSLLIGLAAAFTPMFLADRAVHGFCDGQAPGTPAATVQAHAQQQGYTAERLDAATLRVDDPAGFGRRQCDLALDAQARVTGPAPAR